MLVARTVLVCFYSHTFSDTRCDEQEVMTFFFSYNFFLYHKLEDSRWWDASLEMWSKFGLWFSS